MTWLCLGRRLLFAAAVGLASQTAAAAEPPLPLEDLRLINRLTWGVNASEIARYRQLGRQGWIDYQLSAKAPLTLPPAIEARFAGMAVAAAPMGKLAVDAEAMRTAALKGRPKAGGDASDKQAYAQFVSLMKQYQAETVERSLLRDIYSPWQLREQMTWFWFNHFNVRMGNQPLPTMVRDYEEHTIRPLALGKFCPMVKATLRHPAMLKYLGNAASRADNINENYARELMELHTMGVGSGYSQGDVEQLARVLTGATVDMKTWPAPAAARGGERNGIYVFDPGLHDGGSKTLLGQPISARGVGEIDEAVDRLCRQPATARRISDKLARFFVADTPPPALVDRMATTFKASDGDITAVLRTMIAAPEFKQSLGTLFKDPNHFLISALRLGYDGRIITSPKAAANLLARLGQARFARLTPDGYPLSAGDWNASGQMTTRFDIAAYLGRGAATLFVSEPGVRPVAPPPPLQAILASTGLDAGLAPATRAALDAARGPAEWNALYFSSPDFMRR
jgi:uncharacterized protein (DUF1800 family)